MSRKNGYLNHAAVNNPLKTAVYFKPEVRMAKPNSSDWRCRAGVGIGHSTASPAFSWTGYLLYNHTKQRVNLSVGNTN